LEFDKNIIWWYDEFHDKLYKDSNITKFNLGRKLFNKRAIRYLSIDENEVSAVIYDGKKSYYDVKIAFSPLNYFNSEAIESIFRSNMNFATDLLNGIFSRELFELMTDRNIDIFPSWEDLEYKCSCRKSKKCEHVATVLHRVLNEIIFEPALIFTLRGYRCEEIFSIIAGDPDFKLAEITEPPELTIDHYTVKNSRFDVTEINPLIYYGVDIPEPDLSDIPDSRLTDSKLYYGKIRDEFYGIFDSLTEILKTNVKKF
jgi:uncharacterized Zn finger protein